MKILALDVATNLTGMAIVDFDRVQHSTKTIDSQIIKDPYKPIGKFNRLPNTEDVVDKKINIIYKALYDLSLTKQHFDKIIIEVSAVQGDMGLIKFVGIYRAIIKKLISYDELIECIPTDWHAHYPKYESRPDSMTTKDVSFELYKLETGKEAKSEDEAEAFLIARAYQTIIDVKKFRIENAEEFAADKEAKKRLRKRITTAKKSIEDWKDKRKDYMEEHGFKSYAKIIYFKAKDKKIPIGIEKWENKLIDLRKELKVLTTKGK